MTPQVLGRYLENYIQWLLKYWYESIFNDSSSIGQIPRKVYSIAPQVFVRYLEKYIQ